MHVPLCMDIVTVECASGTKLTFSLHRTCPDGDERLRISETSHFNFIHVLLYCLYFFFFSPHLVVPSMSSYLPCLLFYFVFISLEKSAFLVPCGQILVFLTQIGNIPRMDPSSAPFHFHYWACFVCYIIGNETVIKKKFPYCTCEYLWVKDVKKQRALYQHQRHRTHNLLAVGVQQNINHLPFIPLLMILFHHFIIEIWPFCPFQHKQPSSTSANLMIYRTKVEILPFYY